MIKKYVGDIYLATKNYVKNPMINLSLIFISGMIECYTYLHYGVFASAQTGNFIFLMICIQHDDWISSIKFIIVGLCFILGNICAVILKNKLKKNWIPLLVLYIETGIFYLSLWLPKSFIQLSMISIIDTFQLCFFDSLVGYHYNSFFITGNVKELASNIVGMFSYSFNKSKEKVKYFLFIPLFFSLGAFFFLYSYSIYRSCITIFYCLLFVTIISSVCYLYKI
jgi:uncharacterized membrane protein YoaK (UPF0700 family)